MDDASTEFPADFSGTVRLFPLPNLVMFPHVVQPLRIFEPRYRDLLEQALEGDRLIAMALLLPNWEKAYFDRPAIAPDVCIGRVITHHREANGDYKLLLLGLRRARIVEEQADENCAFRRARVTVLDDYYSPLGALQRPDLQQQLIDGFFEFLPSEHEVRRQYGHLLSAQLPLGPLTDIVGFSIGLDIARKQQLLAELDVDQRAQWLLEWLPSARDPRDFPPEFSAN